MTIRKFEDIEAWKLARELCILVKQATEKELFNKDWELRKQIRNASGSVMDCIAEGFERGNNNEFRFFLGVAKGSCGEVRYQAYRAMDYGYLSEEERSILDQLAKRISAALKRLIDHLNRTDIKGQRYRLPPPDNHDPAFPTAPPPTF